MRFFLLLFLVYQNKKTSPQAIIDGENGQTILHFVDDRSTWISAVERIATPVLSNMAEGKLRLLLSKVRKQQSSTAYFEALVRTLDGISP